MVSALEHHDALAPGCRTGYPKRQQVGLRSRIREAHSFERWVALDQCLGEIQEGEMGRGKHRPRGKNRLHRLGYRPESVTVHERRVVVQHVEVLVPVQVTEQGSVTLGDYDWIGIVLGD